MRTILCIVFAIAIQTNRVQCESAFGSVFPIPLTTFNDDPTFENCPVESGAYAHTTNCSLFHMCTFGIDTIYSCIDGFFFNPTSGKCQYWPAEKETKCTDILAQMMNTDLLPVVEAVKNYDYYHRRKSVASQCTQSGIYPDVLDCSLFHYCRQNKQHDVVKCPNGLRFNPKIFMCSAPQLVNCQYEPSVEALTKDEEVDSTSTVASDPICYDYAPGTHLPIANKFDQFKICEADGRSTIIKCEPGFNYNALTTDCEMKPCVKDTTLCKNGGQCVDEPMNKEGFRCVCSIEYEGEYCEKIVELIDTTKSQINSSPSNLSRFADLLTEDNQGLTTTTEPNIKTDFFQTSTYDSSHRVENHMMVAEKLSPFNSPLFRVLHRLNNNYDQQQYTDQFIQIIFFTILILIGLVLLGVILFGIAVCIRLISTPAKETVGTWKELTEESKV